MDPDQEQPISSLGADAPANVRHFISSADGSLPSSTRSTSSSLSDGKQSTSREKCLAVTLLYSYRHGNNVLFLEAGKDFVDILLSFLTRPMGSIIRLLYSKAAGGTGESTLTVQHEEAIFKLFDSVEEMDDRKLISSKKFLSLDADEADSGFGSELLSQADSQQRQEHGTGTSSCFYSCGMVPHCVCITKKLGRRCPQHGRKMQVPCKFVEEKGERESQSSDTKGVEPVGYVKDICRYFITENLEVFPGSKSLALLHKLKVERMSMLTSLDLFVGMDEIMKLLKASLVSNNVLQDVFGRLVEQRIYRDSEHLRHGPAKHYSGSMIRTDQALYYPIRRCCPGMKPSVTLKCNSLRGVDNKKLCPSQYKPTCSSHLKKPQSFSQRPYQEHLNTQRKPVKPSLSHHLLSKRIYSYQKAHDIQDVVGVEVEERAEVL